MFNGPKLKIERANHHIGNLNDLLVAFLKTDFYAVKTEKNPQDGNYVLTFDFLQQLPNDVPVIIGDAIHNLRAALDLLYCDVIRLRGREPKWAKFPFRATKDEFVTAINRGELKAADPAVVNLIVNAIQPYVGGKSEPIVGLHDLDIRDKHLLIIATVSVTKFPLVKFTSANIRNGVITNLTCIGNGKFGLIGCPSDIQVTGYEQPTLDVCFGEGQPFQNQPVVPTLFQLSQLVSQIVGVIEEHCQAA
jgi:hypothetical protein